MKTCAKNDVVNVECDRLVISGNYTHTCINK